jgi:hypothetical protein
VELKIGGHFSKGVGRREAGLVPWHWITDETRSIAIWAFAPTIIKAAIAELPSLRIDAWGGEPPPLILTESRGVAGALRNTCAEYLVPVTSTNGQVGGFLRTDIVPQLTTGQRVLYFGDHNPAGTQIEANTRRVLEREGGPLDWDRVAVTDEQARIVGLPPKPGTDRRFRDGNPHVSYECEALGQGQLVQTLRERLDNMLLEPLARVLERKARQRRQVLRRLQR